MSFSSSFLIYKAWQIYLWHILLPNYLRDSLTLNCSIFNGQVASFLLSSNHWRKNNLITTGLIYHCFNLRVLLIITYLIRSVLQADKLPIHINFLNADISSSWSWMRDANTTTGLRLFNINPLPFPSGCTHTSAWWCPLDCYTRWWAGGKFQPEQEEEIHEHTPLFDTSLCLFSISLAA